MFTNLMLVTLTLWALLPHEVAAAEGCWRDFPCKGPATSSFPGPWENNMFSPATRILSPINVQSSDGNTLGPWSNTVNSQSFTNGPLLVFDFGKEVGGIVTVTYAAGGAGSVQVSFSEAKNWTGVYSDDSNGAFNTDQQGHADGFLIFGVAATKVANWTLPDAQMRGGFRYLTLNNVNNTDLKILTIKVENSFQPEWPNLRAYGGYFDSDDDLLNKIWYAGAYTLQTNAIPYNTGREFPIIGSGWKNDADISLGTGAKTIYVDGSKRDRTVWTGDLSIAVPSILGSTGDIDGVRNTLNVVFADQRDDGALPFAGPDINAYSSDTYHLASLIGTYDFFSYTGDTTWLNSIFVKYKKAINFITAKIDKSNNLLQVTLTDDWARFNQGGYNSEANIMLYHVLRTGALLADAANDIEVRNSLNPLADSLQIAINTLLWDSGAGGFKDNDHDASLHPQDANSMALLFGITNDTSRISSISTLLTKSWNTFGAVAPELPNNICGFGSSFEVKGHLVAKQATRALELIRRSWGWYHNNPYGTGSTMIEGYLADGTFGYRDNVGYGSYSYTSHAHGWSTGPVDALTTYIVGLQITSPGGSTWNLAPQFGDLQRAQGGFTTPLGKFSASWRLILNGYEMRWSFPSGTVGTILLPTDGEPTIRGAFRAGPGVTWAKAGGWDNKRKVFEVKDWAGDGTEQVIQVLTSG